MGGKRAYGFELFDADDIQRLVGCTIDKVYNTKDDDIIVDCTDNQGRLVSILFSGQGTLHFYDEANPRSFKELALLVDRAVESNLITVNFKNK
ncbi:hypothetical protein [Anaeroselena agilis]|uniref:Uncharacterized protein n=1 Tax=Anaeroselena agilis TaxID=3063788 RepID=A0ABU3NYF9_9FIRM|nr:hypothetical protein [Selenomonadales bacterium 4137-cl]